MIDPRIRLIPRKDCSWNKQNGKYTQHGAYETKDIYVGRPGIIAELGGQNIEVVSVTPQAIVFSDGQQIGPGEDAHFTVVAHEGEPGEELFQLTLHWDSSTPALEQQPTAPDAQLTFGEQRRIAATVLAEDWPKKELQLREELRQEMPDEEVCSLFFSVSTGLPDHPDNRKRMKNYDSGDEMDQQFADDFEKWVAQWPVRQPHLPMLIIETKVWIKNKTTGEKKDITADKHTFAMKLYYRERNLQGQYTEKLDKLSLEQLQETDEKRQKAQQLMAQGRWAEAFDVIYEPRPATLATAKLCQRFASFGCMAIERLREDQISRLQSNAQLPDEAPMAAYLYGYWLLYERQSFNENERIEQLMLAAAEGGIADAWFVLRYMFKSGDNKNAEPDMERMEQYTGKARQTDSMKMHYTEAKSLMYQWFLFDDMEYSSSPYGAERFAEDHIEQEGGPQMADPKWLAIRSQCLMEQDEQQEACRWARMAIDRGETEMGYNMLYSSLYDSSLNYCFDDGGEQERIVLFEGARLGVPICCYAKAQKREEELAKTGKAGERYAQDYAEVVSLYELAAHNGHPDSCLRLGMAWLKGELMLQADAHKAYYYLRRGTMNNSAKCAYALCLMNQEATRTDIDDSKRLFAFGDDRYDHTPTDVLRRYTQLLYEHEELAWPDKKLEGIVRCALRIIAAQPRP